jgi:hypothetical protein
VLCLFRPLLLPGLRPVGGSELTMGNAGAAMLPQRDDGTMQMRRAVGQWRQRESGVMVESDWTGHSSTGAGIGH